MINRRMHYGMTAWEGVTIIVVIIIFLVIFYPLPHGDRESAKRTQCTSNQRQIALAISMYIQEHDNNLPGINWVSDSGADKMHPNVFLCPEVRRDASPGKDIPICYGYNGLLIKDDGTGMKWDSTDKAIDPTIIPLTADVEPVGTLAAPPIMYNTHGRSGAVAMPVLRHKGGRAIYSFLDGHCDMSKTPLLPRGLPVFPRHFVAGDWANPEIGVPREATDQNSAKSPPAGIRVLRPA